MHQIVSEDLLSIVNAPLAWERFAGKTLLISGAAGFIPSFMVETLLMLNTRLGIGCKVVGTVRNLEKARGRFAQYADRADLQLLAADVTEKPPEDLSPNFIIHAASQASPKYYGTDPVGTMEANLLGTHHLLNLARKSASEGFLFISSGEVYGQVTPDKVPTKENDYGYLDVTNVRSCYAESKRAAETLCVSYHQQFQTPCTIVRPFHTYGPGLSLDDGRVFADFVKDIINRRNITLHSDGKAIRTFCYIADAVLGFFTVLLKGRCSQAYNVGNPDGAISIVDLAEMMTGLFPELNLKVQKLQRDVGGYLTSPISINIPDVDRLKALGWKPRILPREGFERTVRFYTEK